jgi:hypothetical protein
MLTMILMGPAPWISHEMLKGPPRPSATGARPMRSGSRFQMAVGKAGCLRVSATVGTLGGGVLGAILMGCLTTKGDYCVWLEMVRVFRFGRYLI